jgi:hypothetical protein
VEAAFDVFGDEVLSGLLVAELISDEAIRPSVFFSFGFIHCCDDVAGDDEDDMK